VLQTQLPQVPGEVCSSLVAFGRVFRHGARDHRVQGAGNIQVESAGRHRFAVHHLKAHRGRTVSMEWRVPRHHDVKNDAERKEIGAPIHGFANQLFGRHVRWGTQQPAGNREVRQVQFGDAEISNLCPAVLRDQDVRRLDVAVDYSLSMGIVERLGDFLHQV